MRASASRAGEAGANENQRPRDEFANRASRRGAGARAGEGNAGVGVSDRSRGGGAREGGADVPRGDERDDGARGRERVDDEG